MSNLAHQNDDHPEAAAKHLDDAETLLQAARYDGAGYLSGYVVECALKTVMLFDQVSQHGAGQLPAAHQIVSRRPYGHNLVALSRAMLGPRGAPYMPDLDFPPPAPVASVLSWSETLRYKTAGTVSKQQADAWYQWASFVYAHSVARMLLDGVL